jgi:hypothetical protein
MIFYEPFQILKLEKTSHPYKWEVKIKLIAGEIRFGLLNSF